MKIIFSLAIYMLASSAIVAQHHDPHDDHSSHVSHVLACRTGVEFIDNLPPPIIMKGVGHSDLKITTHSPSTQQYFNQGVSLLHCFWDFEAYRAFKEAIRLDTSAIMPYWGMLHTLSFIDNEEFDVEQDTALARIKRMVEHADGYEKMYAEGIIDFVETENPEGYLRQLENIVHQYPKDVDAKLFLALYNMAGYDADMNPEKGNLYSEYLLRDLLRTNPDNAGVHHYWIHQMENCCPEEARESAEKLASLAPESGHIVHMPGHIYYKMGDYELAHDQFIEAMKVDSSYMAEQGITELDNWNYIHNLNYLLANCAQDGRYNEGLFYAKKLEHMVVQANRVDNHRGAFFYQGIIVPAVMEMRFGFWDRAVEKFTAITDPDSIYGRAAMDYKMAFQLFSSGMLALEKGDVTSAKIYRDQLDALFWRNSKLEDEKQRLKPRNIQNLEVTSFHLEGNILVKEGKLDEGITVLKDAAEMERKLGYSEPPYYPRPVLLSLSNAYRQKGEYDKAVECMDNLMKKHHNSALAYWELMKIYKESKQKALLAEATKNFNAVTKHGDKEAFR